MASAHLHHWGRLSDYPFFPLTFLWIPSVFMKKNLREFFCVMLSMVPNVIYVPHLAFSILFKLQRLIQPSTMLYVGKVVYTWKVLFLPGIQESWGVWMVSRKILTLYVTLLSFILRWGMISYPIFYNLAYVFWSFDSSLSTHTSWRTKLEFHLWSLLMWPLVCIYSST